MMSSPSTCEMFGSAFSITAEKHIFAKSFTGWRNEVTDGM